MILNGLKVYDLLVDDTEGMYCVSLVESPAVLSNWQAFSEEKKPAEIQQFSVVDEDEKKLFGVVMRADFPIYRYNRQTGEEFYVIFSKDTIRKMAEKFFKNGFQSAINLEHNDNLYVDCVNLQEMFIKDIEKGINPVGFEGIEDGSLFATYQITDDELWGMIKDGIFKGFSLEGFFTPTDTEEKEISTISELLDIIK